MPVHIDWLMYSCEKYIQTGLHYQSFLDQFGVIEL